MQLAKYMKRKKMTLEDFAKFSGIKYGALVPLYYGYVFPKWGTLHQLMRATNGEVTPTDMYQTRLEFIESDRVAE